VRQKFILEQLALGKHLKILKSSLYIALLALIGLFVLKIKAGKDVFSINFFQILNISIQLFAIINPMSALPNFLIYTEGLSEKDKKKIANTTISIVVTLIISFSLFGQLILNALQITVESFQFAGGILLMIIAIDMLGGAVRTKAIDTEQVAIVPLATPLLVGPGTLTTLIILSHTQSVINVLFGGLIAASAVYIFLRFSTKIANVLGKNGLLAGSRLMAIIIAAIAAKMIHSALKAWGIAI
jgi:multiple antibiotic resistance protein